MSVTNARHKLLLLLLVLLLAPTGFSQISHGGQPLPVNASAYTRALQPMAIPFVEMPSFDLQQALLRSSDEEKRFRSLEFAHKFHVSSSRQLRDYIYHVGQPEGMASRNPLQKHILGEHPLQKVSFAGRC